MRYKLLFLPCLLLLWGGSGCKQQITNGNLEKRVNQKVDKASLLPGKKEPLPGRLLLNEKDFQELRALSTNFFELVRSAKKGDAAQLFTPKTKRTAEMLLSRDIELAQEKPADFAPKITHYVWYQNGKLWLRSGAEKLSGEEMDRLVTLTTTYGKAAVIVVEMESGKQKKMLAVIHKGRYHLFP